MVPSALESVRSPSFPIPDPASPSISGLPCAPPPGSASTPWRCSKSLRPAGTWSFLALAHREPVVAPQLRRMGIAVEWQPAPSGVLWQQALLPRRLAAGDIDLFWSPLLTLPIRLPVPAVVTLHDLAAIQVPETLPLKVRWSIQPFLERTVEQARRIVVGSESIAGEVRHAFPVAAGKLRVIPHGVSARFTPAPAERIAALRRGLEAPRGYFLAVGTLEPRKNLDLLLDAWEILRREAPDAALPLILVGAEGWKNRALKRRLERLREAGVRHLGRVEEERLVEAFRPPPRWSTHPATRASACRSPRLWRAAARSSWSALPRLPRWPEKAA